MKLIAKDKEVQENQVLHKKILQQLEVYIYRLQHTITGKSSFQGTWLLFRTELWAIFLVTYLNVKWP